MAENKMGYAPMPKLLLQTSVPLMFSLLMNSLYNFADSVFVSHVNENALTALTMAAPVQMLMGAVGCGIAVGLNSAVSKALGEKNQKEVKDTVAAATVMAVAAWVLMAVLGAVIIRPYFAWQSGGDLEIAAYGEAYLSVCMFCSLGMMGQWVFDRLLIAAGKSTLFLCTLGCAAIVNLLLDPVFIFGYFGFPAMETTGAAIATVVGQFCGAALGIVLNHWKNKEIPVKFSFRVRMSCVVNILRVGIPTFVMQGIVSFMGIFLNSMLLIFSSTAVAVYGVCIRVQNISLIGVTGITCGLIPIIAYNYGAKKPDRIKDCLKWSFIYGFSFIAVMFAILELFPVQILRLFDASENMLAIGVPAIRILAVSFAVSTYGLILASAFQALGVARYSMYLTILRQVVLLAPFAFLSVWIGSITLMWAAFCMAELLSIPFGWGFLRKAEKSLIPADNG